MKLLKDFERKLEKTFEGFFTKSFRSGVHPVELAKKLSREMRENKTVSVSKVYAPNEYTLYISNTDKRKLEGFEDRLVPELQDFLDSQAKKENLVLTEAPDIKIVGKRELSLGEINVESKLTAKEEIKTSKREASLKSRKRGGTQVISGEQAKRIKKTAAKPQAKRATLTLLAGEKKKYPIKNDVTTIGRLGSNDVVVLDPNVSRVHAEVRWEGDGWILVDLGSTNGTYVDGRKIRRQILRGKHIISIGTTKLEFRS